MSPPANSVERISLYTQQIASRYHHLNARRPIDVLLVLYRTIASVYNVFAQNIKIQRYYKRTETLAGKIPYDKKIHQQHHRYHLFSNSQQN